GGFGGRELGPLVPPPEPSDADPQVAESSCACIMKMSSIFLVTAGSLPRESRKDHPHIRPSWKRPPGTRPQASHTPMIGEDALHCRRRSTVPAPAATPAPPHNLECKCLRISPSSTAARRTRCPTPAPDRPCSPPRPPTTASP